MVCYEQEAETKMFFCLTESWEIQFEDGTVEECDLLNGNILFLFSHDFKCPKQQKKRIFVSNWC